MIFKDFTIKKKNKQNITNKFEQNSKFLKNSQVLSLKSKNFFAKCFWFFWFFPVFFKSQIDANLAFHFLLLRAEIVSIYYILFYLFFQEKTSWMALRILSLVYFKFYSKI